MSNIEFTTTSACNFGCTYCFEGHISEEQNKSRILDCKAQFSVQDAVNFIEGYRKNVTDEKISIAFWGGEPFLNWDFARDFMLRYKDDHSMTFMFYTNGSLIQKYFKELVEVRDAVCKNGYTDRLFIQVSYDGVTNYNRLDKRHQSTSQKAIQGFKLLQGLKIKTTMKSTLAPQDFKHLYENFLDVTQYDYSYCPSPDTHTIYMDADVKPYLKDLKENLFKIVNYMYQNDLPIDRFAWFRYSRAMCRTGYHYLTVDVDGSIFPCHGIMYNKQDHIITNLKDPDVYEKINQSFRNFEPYALNGWTNNKCKDCKVNYCIRCPSASAQQFTEGEYYHRFCRVNGFLCSVFKINDHFNKALTKLYLDHKPHLLKVTPDDI